MVTRRTGVQRVDVSGVNTVNGGLVNVIGDVTASAYAGVIPLLDGNYAEAAGLVIRSPALDDTADILEKIHDRLGRIETYLAYLADGEMT